MNALKAANEAAQLLTAELERVGLDVDASGGMVVWSGKPLETGAPYVSIQGAITPQHARMLAQALSLLPPYPGAPTPADHTGL